MSYARFEHLPEMDRLYQLFLQDPESVESSWRHFFEGMQFVSQAAPPQGDSLVDAYRRYGHLKASCNPLSSPREVPQLRSSDPMLETAYCGAMGVEYMHIEDPRLKEWIQTRFETQRGGPSAPEKLQVLEHLTKAELFEAFLHTKYVGQKRFSLEGIESLIPLIQALIERGGQLGLKEVMLGMSHRGRLNVLANVLGKSYAQIFREFEAHYVPELREGTGDVKYHKGFIGALGSVGVTLAANPSHLESVDPLVEGMARALQEKTGMKSVLPLLIHGDAAVAGQGVVYETLQLMKLPGYATGGTVHVIVNNQIGFTTSPCDGRSTTYCSDIAKAFEAPVFHVNAEHPLSCALAARLAIEIRQEFGCDVFIDLNGYRKYGHNEGDEPTFTQPLEYAKIRSRPSIYTLFCQELVREGVLQEGEVKARGEAFKEALQQELGAIPLGGSTPKEASIAEAPPHLPTAVLADTLQQLAKQFCAIPEGMRVHPKIQRLLHDRLEMMQGKIDWGMGEHLAMASLLNEHIPIRLSGQDVGRGTFSHRHALWVDQVTGKPYFPLSHLGAFKAYNSPLSEYAVLGFDFGYSIASPETLVIWEAQFGDFANGAQIPIDQYIASSEQKWGVTARLILLLPHGYEGQGPEHSSARLERFLQLSAQDNMRIVNCTTPAQLFHIVREQGHYSKRKPLILFTPKLLLRHPACVSTLADFSQGSFQELIGEVGGDPSRLLLCSGKVYYDLIAEREKRGAHEVAICRFEQLYPFPEPSFLQLIERYRHLKEIYWVQEEASNMGAWEFVRPRLNQLLGVREAVHYRGRPPAASPAVGSYALHQQQLAFLFETAFKR
jgi:2-oxoglutarate dehydrogenase E1 component